MREGNDAGHEKGNDDGSLRERVTSPRQQVQPTEECSCYAERGTAEDVGQHDSRAIMR